MGRSFNVILNLLYHKKRKNEIFFANVCGWVRSCPTHFWGNVYLDFLLSKTKTIQRLLLIRKFTCNNKIALQ